MNDKEKYEELTKLNVILYDDSRYYDHSHILCVNVKRHNDYVNINELIKDKKYRPYAKEITEHFTENYINKIYEYWLEFERSYLLDDFLGHNCIYSNDDPEYKIIKRLQGTYEFGFYGRSGGWFGCDIKKLQELINGAMSWYETREYDDFNIDYEEIMQEYSDIKWLLNYVDNYNKAMSFKDELIFRIDEYIDEEVKPAIKRARDLKQAVKLAGLYGYKVTKDINI